MTSASAQLLPPPNAEDTDTIIENSFRPYSSVETCTRYSQSTSTARPYLYRPIASLIHSKPPSYDEEHCILTDDDLYVNKRDKHQKHTKKQQKQTSSKEKRHCCQRDRKSEKKYISSCTEKKSEKTQTTLKKQKLDCDIEKKKEQKIETKQGRRENRSSIDLCDYPVSLRQVRRDTHKVEGGVCPSGKYSSTQCILGIGLLLIGFLVVMGFFSLETTTSSITYVEPPVPTYVPAGMVSVL